MKKVVVLLISAFSLTAATAQTITRWKATDLEAYLANAKTPLVMNLWATFCKPCIAEIPYFQTMIAAEQKEKVQLVLVSLDLPSYFPQKIKAFAKKNRYTAPIFWLNETNADYFCPKVDSTWSGSIPASLFYNPKTGYRRFYEKEMSREELAAALKEMLK
jgi:thiol-disulfide isomerase/thioredoxin